MRRAYKSCERLKNNLRKVSESCEQLVRVAKRIRRAYKSYERLEHDLRKVYESCEQLARVAKRMRRAYKSYKQLINDLRIVCGSCERFRELRTVLTWLPSGPPSGRPISIPAKAPIEAAVEIFTKLGIRYLCITQEGTGKLAGFVIKKRVLRYLDDLKHEECD
jgi:hypothetical protein